MVEKIEALLIKYREIIVYVFFGGLTTVVSWGSYFLLRLVNVDYQLAQWISWAAAVAFAFVVNKIFVFRDRDLTAQGLFRQIWQFVSVRIVSGVLEWMLMLLFVELIKIPDGISKIIVSIVTVIINYIASKLLIFRKKNNDGQPGNS